MASYATLRCPPCHCRATQGTQSPETDRPAARSLSRARAPARMVRLLVCETRRRARARGAAYIRGHARRALDRHGNLYTRRVLRWLVRTATSRSKPDARAGARPRDRSRVPDL